MVYNSLREILTHMYNVKIKHKYDFLKTQCMQKEQIETQQNNAINDVSWLKDSMLFT